MADALVEQAKKGEPIEFKDAVGWIRKNSPQAEGMDDLAVLKQFAIKNPNLHWKVRGVPSAQQASPDESGPPETAKPQPVTASGPPAAPRKPEERLTGGKEKGFWGTPLATGALPAVESVEKYAREKMPREHQGQFMAGLMGGLAKGGINLSSPGDIAAMIGTGGAFKLLSRIKHGKPLLKLLQMAAVGKLSWDTIGDAISEIPELRAAYEKKDAVGMGDAVGRMALDLTMGVGAAATLRSPKVGEIAAPKEAAALPAPSPAPPGGPVAEPTSDIGRHAGPVKTTTAGESGRPPAFRQQPSELGERVAPREAAPMQADPGTVGPSRTGRKLAPIEKPGPPFKLPRTFMGQVVMNQGLPGVPQGAWLKYHGRNKIGKSVFELMDETGTKRTGEYIELRPGLTDQEIAQKTSLPPSSAKVRPIPQPSPPPPETGARPAPPEPPAPTEPPKGIAPGPERTGIEAGSGLNIPENIIQIATKHGVRPTELAQLAQQPQEVIEQQIMDLLKSYNELKKGGSLKRTGEKGKAAPPPANTEAMNQLGNRLNAFLEVYQSKAPKPPEVAKTPKTAKAAPVTPEKPAKPAATSKKATPQAPKSAAQSTPTEKPTPPAAPQKPAAAASGVAPAKLELATRYRVAQPNEHMPGQQGMEIVYQGKEKGKHNFKVIDPETGSSSTMYVDGSVSEKELLKGLEVAKPTAPPGGGKKKVGSGPPAAASKYPTLDAFEKEALGGTVYHGTTVERGKQIESQGFHGLKFADELSHALDKMGLKWEDLSKQKQASIRHLESSYEGQLGSVSVTPYKTVAERWAGSGGEIAATIESYLRDARKQKKPLPWGHPESKVGGEPAVIQAKLKELPKRHRKSLEGEFKYIREQLDKGAITEQQAVRDMQESYFDIRVRPEELEQIKLVKSAKNRLRERLADFKKSEKGEQQFLFDTESFKDAYVVAKDLATKMGDNFQRWSQNMIYELGEAIKPRLLDIWDAIRSSERGSFSLKPTRFGEDLSMKNTYRELSEGAWVSPKGEVQQLSKGLDPGTYHEVLAKKVTGERYGHDAMKEMFKRGWVRIRGSSIETPNENAVDSQAFLAAVQHAADFARDMGRSTIFVVAGPRHLEIDLKNLDEFLASPRKYLRRQVASAQPPPLTRQEMGNRLRLKMSNVGRRRVNAIRFGDAEILEGEAEKWE